MSVSASPEMTRNVSSAEQLVGHLHRAGGAERRVLDDVLHRHAEVGAAVEVRFDLVGEVVQRRDDLGDA